MVEVHRLQGESGELPVRQLLPLLPWPCLAPRSACKFFPSQTPSLCLAAPAGPALALEPSGRNASIRLTPASLLIFLLSCPALVVASPSPFTLLLSCGSTLIPSQGRKAWFGPWGRYAGTADPSLSLRVPVTKPVSPASPRLVLLPLTCS